MDKNDLRKWAKSERAKLDLEKVSAELVLKLQNTPEYQTAKNIMIYYPMKDEINLLSLLKDKTKCFYLPRIKDKELECCPYSADDELCESCFHTLEPVCKSCNKTELDMVIVPALAVDKNNYRLGYGGGFYDRFLKDFSGIKVVCIPKNFILDTIFPETFDEKIYLIIS